jgi:hypothetical protein
MWKRYCSMKCHSQQQEEFWRPKRMEVSIFPGCMLSCPKLPISDTMSLAETG